jgi:hypothetical protein
MEQELKSLQTLIKDNTIQFIYIEIIIIGTIYCVNLIRKIYIPLWNTDFLVSNNFHLPWFFHSLGIFPFLSCQVFSFSIYLNLWSWSEIQRFLKKWFEHFLVLVKQLLNIHVNVHPGGFQLPMYNVHTLIFFWFKILKSVFFTLEWMTLFPLNVWRIDIVHLILHQ